MQVNVEEEAAQGVDALSAAWGIPKTTVVSRVVELIAAQDMLAQALVLGVGSPEHVEEAGDRLRARSIELFHERHEAAFGSVKPREAAKSKGRSRGKKPPKA